MQSVHICWRDVADSAVESDVIVVVDKGFHDLPGLFAALGLKPAQGLVLDRAVPALDLAVGLRLVRRGSHVSHAGLAHEGLEVLGNKRWAIVRNHLGYEVSGTLSEKPWGNK